MGVGAGLYMYVVVVQKFTFAISSPGEFLFYSLTLYLVWAATSSMNYAFLTAFRVSTTLYYHVLYFFDKQIDGVDCCRLCVGLFSVICPARTVTGFDVYGGGLA